MADPYIDPRMPSPIRDMIRKQSPYYLGAVVPELSMLYGNHSQFDRDTLAGVDRKMPNTIIFNDQFPVKDLASMYSQTIPHEFEHVLQHRAGQRYDSSYDREVLEQYKNQLPEQDKMLGKQQLMAQLGNAADNPKLYGHLKGKGYTPSPYLGGFGKDQFSLKEQFADLSALEQAHKVDLTQDPVVRKEFFGNNQKLIDTYKATTGLRTDRLDARDLPPMTIPPPPTARSDGSWYDKHLDYIKNLFK